MTFAITIKVNDGIVLAADSASTVTTGASSDLVAKVYYNANKIFNLCKGAPIAAVTWGSGSIGSASVSTLIKDFRDQFSAKIMQGKSFTMEQTTTQLRDFVLSSYLPEFQEWPEDRRPYLGLLVTGYSQEVDGIEEYQVEINGREPQMPIRLASPSDTGAVWRGQHEAVSRLVLGYSPLLDQVFQEDLGVSAEDTVTSLEIIRAQISIQLVSPAMPIQDAIDLAKFLVDVTINFSRFFPGAQVVGGPIEIATITKHEGFRWVNRKHYFPQGLNS